MRRRGIIPKWIVPTKLVPPNEPAAAVSRSRLIAPLLIQRAPSILLIHGPAGFGKTTFLAQYCAALRARAFTVAWLSLDVEQANPSDFVSHLAAALIRAGVSVPPHVFTHARRSPGAALGVIIGELTRHDGMTAVAIDDVQRLERSESMDLLAQFSRRLPPGVQLMASGRQRLELRLTNDDGARTTVAIGPDALAFDDDESRQLLGDLYSPDDVARLQSECEGWPVGLRLLRVTSGRSPSTSVGAALISTTSGRHWRIANYLAHDVYDTLPADVQAFLLATSVLRRVNGDLANALTGRSDGWAMLDWLQNAGVFVSALDEEGRWYRYHQLFAEFLQQELERRHPQDVDALHVRAAQWLITRFLVGEALAHAAEIRNPATWRDLVERVGGWHLYLDAGASNWGRFLQAGQGEARDQPSLVLARVYYLAQRGQVTLARRMLDDFQGRAGGPAVAEDGDAAVMDLLLRMYDDEQNLTPVAHELLERAEQSRQISEPARLLAVNLLAWCACADGQFAKAAAASALCLDMAGSAGHGLASFYARIVGGIAAVASGYIEQATILWTDALTSAAERLGPASDQVHTARAFLGELAFERGEVELASREASDALQVVRLGEAWTDLCLPVYRICAGTAAYRDSARVGMRLLNEAVAHHAEARHGRLRLLLRVQQMHEWLAAGSEQRDELPETVTAALHDAGASSDWRIRLPAMIVLGRLHLLRGNLAEARRCLRVAEDGVTSVPCFRLVIESELLATALAHAEGRVVRSRELCVSTIRRLAGAGWPRPLADWLALLMPVIRPLRHAIGALAPAEASLIDDAEQLAMLARRPTSCEVTPAATTLSPREARILELMRAGLTSKEIARDLGISLNTVLGYRRTLYQKLQVSRRSQALAARLSHDGT